MASLDFFRNIIDDEKVFFDEGPRVRNQNARIASGSRYHNTSSIDTSEIDSFRQGVELTQIKHFDAGTIKIHAGEPGHRLRRNRFGMDKNFRTDPRFEDIEYFSPRAYLLAQESAVTSSLGGSTTWPIITSDNDQAENYTFDGIIEPLTIRAKASFFSIDAPFEAHDVRGAVMAGNTDVSNASDLVQTVYVRDQREQLPFLDQYADTLPLQSAQSGSVGGALSTGYFSNEQLLVVPFADTRYTRNVPTSTTYDADMVGALNLMTGATDNYVRATSNERSATSGWDYDNNVNVGTDSLAFGGRTY